MKALFIAITALFMTSALAQDFKIVNLPTIKTFYRESKADAPIGSEIQAFFQSSDLYKIRRDQWVILVIEAKTGKLSGIAMEFQDGYDYKHIPENRIKEFKASRYVQLESKKSANRKEILKNFEKFMKDKKLKLSGDFIFILMPAIKVKDSEVNQFFWPIE